MTDNELIAVFMGATKHDCRYPDCYNIPDEPVQWQVPAMKYHKSWDWLMPVIDKIDSMMPEIKMPRDLEALKNGTHEADNYMDILSLPMATKIDEVYKETIKFIKWYNERTK